jgi:hypothetical protein
MKKITILVLGLALLSNDQVFSQEERDRVITTAVPFLLIAADARAAGMGDQGVATSADAFHNNGIPQNMRLSTVSRG